ncbi:phage terminase large subunit family protein [Chitinimonas arctica]|uniref:Phage terminase large subunit family protein n=2 Tax=Chitinimonas arctica TaxID=2594795 RepID=A0A516SMJ4_9NEIS|nr:phage terminase large subunit family protein [Chitinimonas arctica]
MSLEAWAAKHFYLSAESSYVEQEWRAWPFQRAIMAVMSNDDIREVDLKKSARVGYTKIILAKLAYNAHHKRRNQALWQPTDEDRDEFVKTELDPMLRDVAVMKDVFPAYMARHKDNTLQAKKFLGSMLHLRGGKAAKNYRRISVDDAILDEVDGFDADVEKEGDPFTLAAKRVEGATFPKIIIGSTPKLKGFSIIDTRFELADARFHFVIPCPSCGEAHPLTWGGKDESHGFKWSAKDPKTVRHLCPHCATLIDQGDYLRVCESGYWLSDDGLLLIDHAGVFRNAAGHVVPAPSHVAMHVWTAYSPAASWSDIVREFLAAMSKVAEGDMTKLKAFINTTLGEAYEQEVQRSDADELKQRAEPFPLQWVPRGGLMLLASVDGQDNRLEVTVKAYGRGCETWTIDHRILYGSPGEDEVWRELEEILFETEYPHAAGTTLRVHATAIDSGGHYTHAVYDFCAKHERRKVFAVKGASGKEKHIKNGAQKVDIDWRGRVRKRGVILWLVGTNLAKDLLYGRMQLERAGPGYVHLSRDHEDEFFKQMSGEVRRSRTTVRGEESRWTPIRKRVEAWDCAVYNLWLETHLELGRKPAKWWDELEARVQPAISDLFDTPPAQVSAPAEGPKPVVTKQGSKTSSGRIAPRRQAPSLASAEWAERL